MSPSTPPDGHALDFFRTGKAYSISQAARLAKTTPASVRRWLMGYEAPGHQMQPVFGHKERAGQPGPLSVSFLELVEIVVVANFRRGSPIHGPIKLQRLRAAHEYARQRFELAYPFASLSLKRLGGHVLHEFDLTQPGGSALALDLGGQWALPGMVRTALEQLDFEEEFAIRWFPLGRGARILVDPRIGAGRPTVAGTGVTADVIRGRFDAGESIQDIADDFELTPIDVEEALRFAAA